MTDQMALTHGFCAHSLIFGATASNFSCK